ncbi:fructose-1-phosphate phosphatase YqaB [Nematostella vectensis]|uniref:fructose-1-phosphate phosphatase YqaB n=1 Tax=Nematostella vectensis TaxID=45351 RepID=UPI0020778919|nr:fructose-1-phosphate phosphatase YqaB [Nematostella vectensis]
MAPERLTISEGVKGLVFDCDGTLLDTMPLHWRAWCKICDETGLRFNKEDFYVLAGVPGKKIIDVLARQQGVVLDPLEVYESKRKYFLSELASVSPIQCVLKYVHEARKRGIPVAVASGSSKKQVEKALKDTGILELFDVILGNEDYSNHKPHPDAFLTAAKYLGVAAKDCWGFEDTDIGLESIRRAGFGNAVDVRLFAEYPDKRPSDNKDITQLIETSRKLRRAFTIG